MQNRRPNRIGPGKRFRFRTGGGGSTPLTPESSPAEVEVLGNGVVITNNDITPSVGDSTDFGSVVEGQPAVCRTFTVRNTGGTTMTISGLRVPLGFSIAEGLPSSILPGGEDAFSVHLDTAVVGTKSGDVSFETSDSDENPFVFSITGIVTAGAPALEVSYSGFPLTNGDPFQINFGTTTVGAGDIDYVFRATNIGSATLTVSSITVPDGFSLVESATGALGVGEYNDFTVRLDDSVAGGKAGAVTLLSNDPVNSPFVVNVRGTVDDPTPPPPPPPPPPPDVSLTAPTAGGTSTSVPVTVSATATANSPATSITQVEFFAGGSSIGVDTSSPFSVSWSPDNGTYTLQAQATDNLGGTALSTTLSHTVTVSPPSGTAIADLAYFNDTSSSIPANAVTRMFGHQYREGDVPAGEYPQFELEDGTPVPSNTDMATPWPDGSLCNASHTLRVPVGISALVRTFTISGTTITLANQTGLTNGDAVVLKSSQVMRRPFRAWKVYYVRLGASNTATIHATAANAIAGTSAILPSTVAADAGSGTFSLCPALKIKIKNGGSAPAASGFDTTTITSNSDLKLEVVGALELSGTYTSSVNTGISDGGLNVFAVADGPVSRTYRVYQEFNNGSDHAHFGANFYLQILKNSSGGLYGIRCWPDLHNGWDDVTTPKIKTLGLASIVLKDGASTVVTPQIWWAARTFTASGGVLTSSVVFEDPGQGDTTFPKFPPVKITTTGTLPTGLTPNAFYWMRAGILGTTFTLHPTYRDCVTNVNAVTVTGSGSGTHSFAVCPWVDSYAIGPGVVGTDGEYNFIQGTSGTGTEAAGQIFQDTEYIWSTKAWGSYRTDSFCAHIEDRAFCLQTAHALQASGTTGAAPMMGNVDSWTVRYMIHRNSRRGYKAVIAGNDTIRFGVRKKSTRTIVNTQNATYAGMGTAKLNHTVYPGYDDGKWRDANIPDTSAMVLKDYFWTHAPGIAPAGFLIHGEPQYLDKMHAIAASAITHRYADPIYDIYRTQNIGGTLYYNVLSNAHAERESSWIIRDVAYPALISPETWQGVPIRQYFKDIVTRDATATRAKKALQTAFAQSIKWPKYHVPSGDAGMSTWSTMFLIGARIIAWMATRDANIKLEIEERLVFSDNVRTLYGCPQVDCFIYYIVPPATSWDNIEAAGSFGTISSTPDDNKIRVLCHIGVVNHSGFVAGDTITGASSGAQGIIYDVTSSVTSSHLVRIWSPTGTFTVGETVTGAISGSSTVTNALVTSLSGVALSEIPIGPIANGAPFIADFPAIPGVTVDTTYYVKDWNSTNKTFRLSTSAALTDTVELTLRVLLAYGAQLPFIIGDTVTGATSGKTGVIAEKVYWFSNGALYLSGTSGLFTPGETITGALGGSATVVGSEGGWQTSTQTGGLRTGGSTTVYSSQPEQSAATFYALAGYTKWAKAAGFTIPAGLLESYEAFETASGYPGGPINFDTNTAYNFKKTFTF